jgi:hypothetical protein
MPAELSNKFQSPERTKDFAAELFANSFKETSFLAIESHNLRLFDRDS